MIGALTRAAIMDRLEGKPYLIPLYTNLYRIPERLAEYDERLFIVRNVQAQRYEVHALDNEGDTFAMVVPYKALDARIIERVKRSDIRMRGKDIFREIDEENEKLERSARRQRTNEIDAQAREMHPYFRKLGWEGV